MVRTESYRLLNVLCKQRKTVVDVGIVAPMVCTAIGKEADPAAAGALWQALLALLEGSRPGAGSLAFWEAVPYRKSFFPQLWSFFGDGVRGAGERVYPNLLPFVALIPNEVMKNYGADAAPLLETMFDKLWEGRLSSELGAHNMPFLLRGCLECIAFLQGKVMELSNTMDKAVVVLREACVRIVRFYLEEPMQFKRGAAKAFKEALQLVVKQVVKHVPDVEAGQQAFMMSMYSLCEECFAQSDLTGESTIFVCLSMPYPL